MAQQRQASNARLKLWVINITPSHQFTAVLTFPSKLHIGQPAERKLT